MPTFDLTPEPSNTPTPSGRQVSNAPQQIYAQGQRALDAGFSAVTRAIRTIEISQNDSDMVMARQSVLKLQQEEKQAIDGTSNPDEIRKISQDYSKKYDAMLSGKNSHNGNPYFRNQSGRKGFDKEFMNDFQLKRELAEEDRIHQIDRRNTQLGYLSAIKMIPQQDYFKRPQAEREVAENIDKMVEDGFYTQAEGADKKRMELTNLDLERGNRIVAELSTKEYSSDEDETFDTLVESNIDYIHNLKHLDETQKAKFEKNINSAHKTAKNAYKIGVKEVEYAKGRSQATADTDAAYKVATGKMTLSEAYTNPELSMKFRTKLAQSYKEQTAEAQVAELDKRRNAKIESLVYNYDPKKDQDGEKKKRLTISIIESSLDKGHYLNILNNGIGLDDKQKTQLDAMDSQLKFELGVDVSIDDKGELKGTQGREGFELGQDDQAGRVFKDELDNFQRLELYNNGMGLVRDLMQRGKIDEAKTEFRKVIKGVQKSKNDKQFYDTYISDEFIRTKAK